MILKKCKCRRGVANATFVYPGVNKKDVAEVKRLITLIHTNLDILSKITFTRSSKW